MTVAWRSAWRCLVLVVALALGATVHAQDATTSIAQAAARQWLAGADALDGATTWKAAGEKFRAAITVERWSDALRVAREPLGDLQQRTAASTTFSKDLPGVPTSEYAVLQYRTSFARKAEAGETVTLEREPDGAWRVIGYFIR